MKILLPLLFATGMLLAAQPLPPPAGSPSALPRLRCVFLIDTSHGMAEHKSDIADAVAARLRTGLDGQLRSGDLFLIRIFNETVSRGADLQGVWNPQFRKGVPPALEQALRNIPFGGAAQLDFALKSVANLAADSDDLTMIVVSDAANRFTGTPFDPFINDACGRIAARGNSRSSPVLITLLAARGQMLAWSVEPLAITGAAAGQTTPDLAVPRKRPVPQMAPRHAASSSPRPRSAAVQPGTSFDALPGTWSSTMSGSSHLPIFDRPPRELAVPATQSVGQGAAQVAKPIPAPARPSAVEESNPPGPWDELTAASLEAITPPAAPANPQPSAAIRAVLPTAIATADPKTPPPAQAGAETSEPLEGTRATASAAANLGSPGSKAPPPKPLPPPSNAEPKTAPTGAIAVDAAHPASARPVSRPPTMPAPERPLAGTVPPFQAAPAPLISAPRLFLLLGLSLVMAGVAGSWFFARRRRPGPAVSLISRSLDGSK